jgi:hypothetical protein
MKSLIQQIHKLLQKLFNKTNIRSTIDTISVDIGWDEVNGDTKAFISHEDVDHSL